MPIQRNSILWTRSQIDQLTEGTWLSGGNVDWFATGVRREPQHVAAGDLFITAGPVGCEVVTNDVNRLFARGAVAVITSALPNTDVFWGPVRLVADTRRVYEALAADALTRNVTQVVAVTGSVGKTGTKDAIAHVLSHQGTVLSNPRSANSDTVILELLCQLAPNIDYAIAELGMLGPHSIARKAALCQPHVAVITSINSAHRMHHRSDLSIAETKSEILDGIRPGGTAVLPRDSEYFDYLLNRARSLPNIERILTFGKHAKADVQLLDLRLNTDSTAVVIDCCGVRLTYTVGLPGEHHALNSLAVMAVATSLGADKKLVASSLASLPPSFRRCERFRVVRADGVCEVIDDTWNASPDSVTAAIELLSLRPIPTTGRRILILGDMLELGPDERVLHVSLADAINAANINVVHTVGELTKELQDALPKTRQGRHFHSSRELATQLDNLIQAGDCLLVKGSNSMEMVRVVSSALRGSSRNESAASRNWNLAVEFEGCDGGDFQPSEPDQQHHVTAPLTVAEATTATGSCEFLNLLRSCLQDTDTLATKLHELDALRLPIGIPPRFWGFAFTLYQPGIERLMVVRVESKDSLDNVRRTVERVRQHPRFGAFDLSDCERCRIQVDFIVDEPQPVDLATLSETAVPNVAEFSSAVGGRRDPNSLALVASHGARSNGFHEQVGADWQVQVADWTNAISTKRTMNRFELGVDGLRIVKEGKRRYFLPGDAFVRSILGIGQLRRHIQRLFPGDDIEQLTYYRFRSLSFVSGVDDGTWLPLYRGMPPVPEVNAASLARAARAGTRWIADNLQGDGRFIYYYDAATDTRRDHEHPTRDPETDPYYNLLRHAGGVITLLLDEQLRQSEPIAPPSRSYEEPPSPSKQQGTRPEDSDYDADASRDSWSDGFGEPSYDSGAANRRSAIERSLDFFVAQLVDYETEKDEPAAYALYNRKAKLGGSGIGLCALAMYQRLFEDDLYAASAERLANHLMSEINEQGEFRYYHIYLDKPVAWEENQRYFSFYYPGEAILGLSQYSQYVCQSDIARRQVYDKTHQALRFLLRERPQLHKEHYQSLPSDSWLMMGISHLWNVAEFQQEEYKRFVFDDADQMVRLMYTEENALYPDYVGSFYYHYGDHPYPDGARAEGLLAAYQLALKVHDEIRIDRYRDACHKVALATLRLCNTPESVYSAANPERAIGGIRFKLTRQWFRVDTIQHVASFYTKLLTPESESP